MPLLLKQLAIERSVDICYSSVDTFSEETSCPGAVLVPRLMAPRTG